MKTYIDLYKCTQNNKKKNLPGLLGSSNMQMKTYLFCQVEIFSQNTDRERFPAASQNLRKTLEH